MSTDDMHPHLRLVETSPEENKLNKKKERQAIRMASAKKPRESLNVFSEPHFIIIGVCAAGGLLFVELFHTWELVSAFIRQSNGDIDPVRITGVTVIGGGAAAVIYKTGQIVYRVLRAFWS